MEILEGHDSQNSLNSGNDFKFEIEYLKMKLAQKMENESTWGMLFLCLREISKNQELSDEDCNLALAIEFFMQSTDFIDDLMDKDNSDFNQLPNRHLFTKKFLKYSLARVFDQIKTYRKKEIFTANLWKSLIAQIIDVNDCVNWKMTEENYFFEKVDRSFYLLNSIVQLALLSEEDKMGLFSYYYSVANQIQNDVANILSHVSSDLKDRKPTLPIIKGIQSAKTNNDDIVKKYYDYVEYGELEHIDLIRDYILSSGTIEYCRYISQEFDMLAFHELKTNYPKATDRIDFFYSNSNHP